MITMKPTFEVIIIPRLILNRHTKLILVELIATLKKKALYLLELMNIICDIMVAYEFSYIINFKGIIDYFEL